MRLYNLLKNLCQKVGLIDDYIVERGTSGIWTYEKWNSGKMVAWNPSRQFVSARNNNTSTLGNDRSCSVSLPTDMKTVENVSGFAAPATERWSVWGVLSGWAQDNNLLWVYSSGNSAGLYIAFSLSLIGKWK